jgi:hypothetical protein
MKKLNLKIISMTLVIFLAGFFIFPFLIFTAQDISGNLRLLSADSDEQEHEDAEDQDDGHTNILAAQDTSVSYDTGGTVKYVYSTSGMVKYVFEQVFGREPYQAEINSWVNNFNNGNASAYSLVNMAMFGIEMGFQVNALNNKDYVYFLYKCLLQRTPDLDGLNAWYNRLQSGKSKNEVLQGFMVSQEFANFCSKFDVKPYLLKEINNKNILALYKIGSSPKTFTGIDMQQSTTASSSVSSSTPTTVTNTAPASTTTAPPPSLPPGHKDIGSKVCGSCHAV